MRSLGNALLNALEKGEQYRVLALFDARLAGMCTFLNVYCTPLLPLLRETFYASELDVSLTVSGTILATALTAPIIGMIAERWGARRSSFPRFSS